MEGVLIFIVGFISFGVVLFLMFAVVSKISGRPIKNSGIVSGGNVIMEPQMLDEIGKGIRGIVDKKYKIRRKIESEMEEELREKISPYDKIIDTCFRMYADYYTYSIGIRRTIETEIFEMIGIDIEKKIMGIPKSVNLRENIFSSSYNSYKLSQEEKNKILILLKDMKLEKNNLSKSIIDKYKLKEQELIKYL